ncbi:MAG: Flp pilus assembly protein CpaB [Candidatus Rokuibacteriota bacterium]|nr:MAG: Flp pilus assembly protein CpaB [Candidatus Rokubacteria bacterium]
MSQRGHTFMGLALALGLAAAGVAYYSINAISARAAANAKAQVRDVVVTATDITYGVKLEKTQLQVVHYPKDAVPLGAFSTVDSVVGQTTKVFLGTREAVTATKLSSRGGGLSMLVRTSMRAASIEVNQVSGVSGFVLPGDRVDVLSTIDNRSADGNAVTKTVLQNIEVLAAGQKTDPKEHKPISVQAVTLLVDPVGAEILAHAMHEGEIHLVLRNPDDQTQVDVAATSTMSLLGITPKAPAPTPSKHRSASPQPAPVVVMKEPDPRTIRIIRSANVTEQPAVVDSK